MKIVFFDEFTLGVLKGDAVVDVSRVVQDIPHLGPQDIIRGVIERFTLPRLALPAVLLLTPVRDAFASARLLWLYLALLAWGLAFFVTRAKTNLDFSRRSSRRVDKTTGLRSDQTIVLDGPGARTVDGYVLPPSTDPDGVVTYTVTLTGDGNTPLGGQLVRVILRSLIDEILGATFAGATGADGKLTVSFRPAFVRTSDWRIEARFDGDWWYRAGETHTLLSVAQPDEQTVHVLPLSWKARVNGSPLSCSSLSANSKFWPIRFGTSTLDEVVGAVVTGAGLLAVLVSGVAVGVSDSEAMPV